MLASFTSIVGRLALILGLLINLVLAQCGPENGGARCPLNTCCSSSGYCGTSDIYCGDGCQSAYGSCSIPTVPSCSTGRSSCYTGGKSATNGRRVGYWRVKQAWDRSCNVVLPSQIQTEGLTHLILAFAHFDPDSFAVGAEDPKDVPYYTQFTALQSSSLQTWISIGGGSFSSDSWSSMVASSSSRSAFISSLKSFMETHSFQGVDLDWEFPAASTADGDNFVSLVRELRDAFGNAYGISVPLPSDWGSLQGFNPAGMGEYVDFFNYMAYDLHGWGVDAEPTKNVVTYQASILDIATNLMPLWANHTNASLINLGIPLYGRGYTLSSSSCKTAGCAASGPSEPGSCLADPTGVMVLSDIKTAISANDATVELDSTAMQKYATWGSDQWIAYDDGDTLALKMAWADGLCMGGAMFWTLDNDGGAWE
ncbi:glycoside hydrolase superfamily [Fusarium solani]|uniref:chitinase n=1 Tax=Fusarium solani TaxID=169388 RepID=A0A9P9KN86_FUSSL|nr:glycoside hydrolase superfamily [Fusarium solani]KAH7264551.1 glycoside hydrolase superfamily [Fusarium solani]